MFEKMDEFSVEMVGIYNHIYERRIIKISNSIIFIFEVIINCEQFLIFQ